MSNAIKRAGSYLRFQISCNFVATSFRWQFARNATRGLRLNVAAPVKFDLGL